MGDEPEHVWGNYVEVVQEMMKISPQIMDNFRIQPIKKLTREKVAKLFANIALNIFVVVPLIGRAAYWCQKNTSMNLIVSRQLPSPMERTIHTGLFILFNEAMFFYGHWLMHANKWLYKSRNGFVGEPKFL